jgi:uncharacterized protein (UPF0332 family)
VDRKLIKGERPTRFRLRISVMIFDWKEYFRLATELARASDEASQRSAISRAYYFVFHVALDRAKANLYRQSEAETSHNSLWSYYERNANEECRRIAFLGRRLHKRRVRADYHDEYERVNEEAGQVLIDAKRCAEIIGALPAQYPQDPPPRIRSF